jgi:hypothetical protein
MQNNDEKGKSKLNETTSLSDLESEIEDYTLKNHKYEIRLIKNMLQVFMQGFNLIGEFNFNEENKITSAWILLVVRSFRSMRSAMVLMLIGYYIQAISLLRTVTEDWLICKDCTENEETLQTILLNKDTTRRLNYSEMAERTKNQKIYKHDYRDYSKFIHASSLSLASQKSPDSNKIKAWPSYNKLLFLYCCVSMLRNTLRTSEFMEAFLSRLSEDRATSWKKVAIQPCIEAHDWLNKIKDNMAKEPESSNKNKEVNHGKQRQKERKETQEGKGGKASRQEEIATFN